MGLGEAIALVGIHNVLHKRVSDYVALGQADKSNSSCPAQDSLCLDEARLDARGEVYLGDVARDDGAGALSSRVRNIFIWTEVVFCASSRMANAWSRVRPRM